MHRHTPLVKVLPPTFPIGGAKTGLADVLPAQRRCKPRGTNQKASSSARCKNGFSTVAETKKTPQSSFSPTYGCYVKTYDSDWGAKTGLAHPINHHGGLRGAKTGLGRHLQQQNEVPGKQSTTCSSIKKRRLQGGQRFAVASQGRRMRRRAERTVKPGAKTVLDSQGAKVGLATSAHGAEDGLGEGKTRVSTVRTVVKQNGQIRSSTSTNNLKQRPPYRSINVQRPAQGRHGKPNKRLANPL